MTFTKEDYDLMLDALECFPKIHRGDDKIKVVQAIISCNGDEDKIQSKFKELKRAENIETQELKERCVILRAKLIEAKNKAIIDEATGRD